MDTRGPIALAPSAPRLLARLSPFLASLLIVVTLLLAVALAERLSPRDLATEADAIPVGGL